MDLYKMMMNISQKNNEEELDSSIKLIKEELKDLTEERMCKVYNNYLLQELKKRHIPARMINTLDLECDYEHVFLLIPTNEEEYFLADLTYSQFNPKDQTSDLLTKGYKTITDDEFNEYLKIVSQENIENLSVKDVFYSNKNSRRK